MGLKMQVSQKIDLYTHMTCFCQLLNPYLLLDSKVGLVTWGGKKKEFVFLCTLRTSQEEQKRKSYIGSNFAWHISLSSLPRKRNSMNWEVAKSWTRLRDWTELNWGPVLIKMAPGSFPHVTCSRSMRKHMHLCLFLLAEVNSFLCSPLSFCSLRWAVLASGLCIFQESVIPSSLP